MLIDCVEGGASVSFMLPMTRDKAHAFWSKAADGVARGERMVFAAEDAAGAIVGTVQVSSTNRRTSRIEPTLPRCWCIDGRAGSGSVRLC